MHKGHESVTDSDFIGSGREGKLNEDKGGGGGVINVTD